VTALEIATLVFAFTVAGGVKGLMGMGLPLVAIAILSTAIDIRAAIPLAVIPVVVLNVWQWLRGPHTGRVIRRFMPLSLSACVGVVIGTQLLFLLDPRIALATLGLLVCAYVGFNLFAFHLHLPPHAEPWAGPAIGLVGGIFCGAAGSIGPTVAAYLQALRVGKDEFVQATGMIFFIAGIPWLIALFEKDALTPHIAAISAAAIVPAALGMTGGAWLRKRISDERFRLVIYGALLIIGLNLLRKAVF
jgi:uncharacterized membrane protein YfcA